MTGGVRILSWYSVFIADYLWKPHTLGTFGLHIGCMVDFIQFKILYSMVKPSSICVCYLHMLLVYLSTICIDKDAYINFDPYIFHMQSTNVTVEFSLFSFQIIVLILSRNFVTNLVIFNVWRIHFWSKNNRNGKPLNKDTKIAHQQWCVYVWSQTIFPLFWLENIRWTFRLLLSIFLL